MENNKDSLGGQTKQLAFWIAGILIFLIVSSVVC
jgi:hypothetical protein